jgi:hypothetical protein
MHRQWYRFGLIRAGQYCIRWEDFEDQQLLVKSMFLVNSYSLNVVEFLWKQL